MRRGSSGGSGQMSVAVGVTGFTVPSSGVVNYTIDFDLRKAILNEKMRTRPCVSISILNCCRCVSNAANQITRGIRRYRTRDAYCE